MPRYEPVNFGFSTADGECPIIHYERGEVRFRFTDWQEQHVEFIAADVLYFCWADEFFELELRDDTSYEVLDSPLVAKYREFNLVGAEEPLRHFKLCFNAQGVFDVVCSEIRRA